MECPNCHVNASVSEQQFGALYTCNDCKAVYFINFDGQPEYGENLEEDNSSEDLQAPPSLNIGNVEPPQLEPITADPLAGYDASANQQNTFENQNIESGYEGSLEPLIDSTNVVDFDNKLDQQFEQPTDLSAQLGATENNLEIQNTEQQATDFSLDFNTSEANPIENIAVDVPTQNQQAVISNFKQVAKEISDFGNTEVQIATLNYDLTVEGLDTIEIRSLFREAIEDLKFGWDVSEIMNKITNGSIVFEKLNPVKAFILAKRLQFIDVEKKWRQNAIS